MVKKSKNAEENKTRKVTLAFKPSVFEAFQKAAHISYMSPNHLLGLLMEKYVIDHKEEIEQYSTITEKMKIF